MDFDAEDVEELNARKRVQRQPTGLTRPGVHPAAIEVHNPAMTLGHRVPLGCLAAPMAMRHREDVYFVGVDQAWGEK